MPSTFGSRRATSKSTTTTKGLASYCLNELEPAKLFVILAGLVLRSGMVILIGCGGLVALTGVVKLSVEVSAGNVSTPIPCDDIDLRPRIDRCCFETKKGGMMADLDITSNQLNRRAFIHNGALFLLGAGFDWTRPRALLAEDKINKPRVRIGMVTDLHYADKPPAGSRHYRETIAKLAEAAGRFQKDKPDFLVELGDFIDAADSVPAEKTYLKRINRDFAGMPGKKHYVLGNHCVYTLTKNEFLEAVGQKESYYSYDVGKVHFVVLDSCFRSDGTPYGRKNFVWTDPNIPAAEVDWLRSDLKQTPSMTIVFAHQRLDVSNHYGVKNASEIRKILQDAGNVLAVFQGHSHRNDYKQISGIHYCTLVAMVEGSGANNSGYSTMDIFDEGTIRIIGFRKQKKYEWP